MIKFTYKLARFSAYIFTGTVLISSGAIAADDIFQDSGSWLQVVGEGSLKIVDPSVF